MSAPRVTAIVVVHGSPAMTVEQCISSLLSSSAVDLHVVLVDNASPDGGLACDPWRGHEGITVVRSMRNGGFAAGVNQALPYRRDGDLVFLLNDDATVAADCIATCAVTLANHASAIAVAPRVMLAEEPDRVDSIGVVLRANGEAFNAYIGQRWTNQVADGAPVLGPCFSAALTRVDAFDDGVVGLLDERYRLYYEDIDWVLRARRAGYTAAAATNAVVHHQHAASTRLLGEPSRYGLVQRNLLLCATKNLSARSAVHVWATRVVVHAKGLITGPYRRHRVRSLLGAIAGIPAAVRSRRRLPRPLIPADAELFAFSDGLAPSFDATTYRASDG